MPETKKFVKEAKGFFTVIFHTCRYQSNLPQAERYKKPQAFGGTLPGLMTLGGFCNCGEGAVHDQIIGKEKSKAAGEYPVELCRKYAGLAVTHFIKMGKAEFLEAKHILLEKNIAKLKEISEVHKKEMMECRPTTPPRSTSSMSTWTPRKRKLESEGGEDESAPAASDWVGGRGKYGLVRESASKKDCPKNLSYVGGMRNPLKAVEGLPSSATVCALGTRVNGAWDAFLKKHPQPI